jgi:hypothetical protein
MLCRRGACHNLRATNRPSAKVDDLLIEPLNRHADQPGLRTFFQHVGTQIDSRGVML